MARRALVIGGGWAGCAAAWALSRRGWRVELFEKSRKLGGRASSQALPGFEDEVDNGQHLFAGSYRQVRRLLEGLGTWEALRFQRPLQVPYLLPGGRQEVLVASSLPGPLALGMGLKSFGLLDAREKAQVWKLGRLAGGDLLKAALGLPNPGLDSLSAAAWLARAGQGPGLVAKFWEPLCLAALNASAGRAGAAGLAAVLSKGFLRGGFAASLGFSRLPLSRLLQPALDRALEAGGGAARLERGVESLEIENGRVRALRDESGAVEKAEAFVVALPHFLAPRLFAPEWRRALGLEALAAWKDSPIVSVHLRTRQPLLNRALGAFARPDGGQPDFHWAFDRARLTETPAGPESWTSFVRSEALDLVDLPREAVLERLHRQLQEYLPGFQPGDVIRSLVLKEKRATPLMEPGCARLRLPQHTAVPNLCLAGDWTDTGLPATIEGAVASGFQAAARFA